LGPPSGIYLFASVPNVRRHSEWQYWEAGHALCQSTIDVISSEAAVFRCGIEKSIMANFWEKLKGHSSIILRHQDILTDVPLLFNSKYSDGHIVPVLLFIPCCEGVVLTSRLTERSSGVELPKGWKGSLSGTEILACLSAERVLGFGM